MKKIGPLVIVVVAIAMIIAIPTLAGAVVGMLISFMFAIDVSFLCIKNRPKWTIIT
ncbi:hypothetical protein [Candidatus Nanosynbacter sp. HMT-352]|uniref:hypothetical protein n=1 Tax=Candidatus Nanosynbacter sp. HMT-352 TaxID=2899133 RepID=UPI001E61BE58|nr:hypothetical protein [Candidatus Nanosynbacter sp. HMT-352]UHA57582.1 hypothetical protein LR957_01090 [Candidatus Nanosynbacter sp. HMT-352]